ncbi:hypothetical protein, partial [Escherichia coli]|uniref:hypothetical protein n=1 Tax=Escherichia coli TaxID=562 RepID=UPI002FE055E2
RNRSHWSTSKTPSYTKSVSWQHHLNLKSRNLSVSPFKNSVNTLTYWYTKVASDKNALNLE